MSSHARSGDRAKTRSQSDIIFLTKTLWHQRINMTYLVQISPGTVRKKCVAIQAAHSRARLRFDYDETVTSNASSAGSMMPVSIDPHTLHLKQ